MPNNGNAKIFSGATDAEVKQYFIQLTGKPLPSPEPLNIRGIEGVRYTIKTPEGNITLRSVSSSSNQTGPAWTIDIPPSVLGTSSKKEIKFLREKL